MIEAVTVINDQGDFCRMELRNPEKSGFLITSIDGIGPADANVSITELSANDGGVFNSARIKTRNILLNLAFLPNPTIEDTRLSTYRYFPLKKWVTLLFETDNRNLLIDGVVEKNDPDIFSENESTQISILCPDPFFRSEATSYTNFAGVVPAFEFPFSNESLDEPLIEFSLIELSHTKEIVYLGDADVGVTIKIHILGPVGNISIYNLDTQESMVLDVSKVAKIVGSSIKALDDIVITTMTGKKTVTFIRDGISYNILNALDRDAAWFKLSKGINVFGYSAVTGDENLRFMLENEVLYEGV